MGMLRLRFVIELLIVCQFGEARFDVPSTKQAPAGAVQFNVTALVLATTLVMLMVARLNAVETMKTIVAVVIFGNVFIGHDFEKTTFGNS